MRMIFFALAAMIAITETTSAAESTYCQIVRKTVAQAGGEAAAEAQARSLGIGEDQIAKARGCFLKARKQHFRPRKTT